MGESTIRGNVSHGDGVYKSTDGGKTWQHMRAGARRATSRKVRVHPTQPRPRLRRGARPRLRPEPGARRLPLARTAARRGSRCCSVSDRGGRHRPRRWTRRNPRILYAAFWEARRTPHELDQRRRRAAASSSRPTAATPGRRSRATRGCRKGMLGQDRHRRLARATPGASGRSSRPKDGGGLPLRRRRRDVAARQRGARAAAARLVLHAHLRRPARRRDASGCSTSARGSRPTAARRFSRGPDAARRQPRPLDRPEEPAADDRGQRRRRVRLLQRRRSVVDASTTSRRPSSTTSPPTTRCPTASTARSRTTTTISLPSRSTDGGDHAGRTGTRSGGGESGYIAVRPDDPEHRLRAAATAGIITRYDQRTGQSAGHHRLARATRRLGARRTCKYRFQWTFPIVLSPHDPNVALHHRRNTSSAPRDEGQSWEVISPDLTRNDPSTLESSGGPITQRQHRHRVLRDDLRLRRVAGRGRACSGPARTTGWSTSRATAARPGQNVTPPELPEWALVSIIEPSPHDAGTAYVAADRYKLDDFAPVPLQDDRLRQDAGRRSSTGIPADDFARVIREDPYGRGLLYAGTETGRLRLVRRRRRTGSRCSSTCRSCRSTT